jgi:hypothetical protein
MLTITYHGRKIRLDDDMLRTLQWALKHVGRWQDIGREKSWQRTVKRLEAAGLVEIFEATNQYRVSEKALAAGVAKRAPRGRKPAISACSDGPSNGPLPLITRGPRNRKSSASR